MEHRHQGGVRDPGTGSLTDDTIIRRIPLSEIVLPRCRAMRW